MRDTFEILAGFLDKFGGDVEGREITEPAEEAKTKLRQFARGVLPEPDRVQMLGELRQHPAWVAWLALEVKSLREGTKNPMK
jgi:hypothetical protein